MKHRDKSSTILMFIVFFLTFFVLWNVADLVSRIENQKQGSMKYKNNITFKIEFNKLEELLGEGKQEEAKQYISMQLQDIYEVVEQIEGCNVSFTNLYFPVKSKRDNVFTEVIVKENIALPYKIDEEINSSGAVFIGETLKEYMFYQDKTQYICVNDENYPVSAMLENYGMSKQDERIILRFDKLSDSEKKAICDQIADYYFKYTVGVGAAISLGGDSEEAVNRAYAELEAYFHTLENVDVDFTTERIPVGELNYWYQLYHSLFGGVSILFAILNGIVVSTLWFGHRQKEYLIRLTFGYTKRRIWFLVWRELGKVSVLSLVCSTILWMMCQFIRGNEISWHMTLIQCIIMLLGTVIVLFITTVPPLTQIMALDPAEALSRNRR